MPASARSLTFKIRGDYDNSATKELQRDLDHIAKIKAFKALNEGIQDTEQAFKDALQRSRELREEVREGGGKDIVRQYNAATKEVSKFSKRLKEQKDQAKKSSESLEELGYNATNLTRDLKKLEKQAEESSTQIAAAMKSGIRPAKDIQEEIKGIDKALDALKSSGAPLDDIARATEKARKRKKELRLELRKNVGFLKKYRQELKRTDSELSSLGATAAAAVTAFGGFEFLKILGGTVTDFNSTLEGSQTGIAAIVRTFDESEPGLDKYNKSMRIASQIQSNLQIEGLKTTATYKELLIALQEGLAPAFKRGFDPEQVVKFTSSMTQAAAAISLPMDQLGQELRAILDGTIDKNARIAQVLGITNEKIKEMADQGKLYDYLMDKLSAFGKAGDDASKQWAGAVSNLQDAVELALGKGFESSFKAATQLVLDLTSAIVTIDEEAGTFTFNEKLASAISEVNTKIEEFLRDISPEDIEKAIGIIADTAKSLLGAILNITKAGVSLVNALGPAAPLLAEIVTYLAAIGGPVVAAAAGIKLMIGQVVALNAAIAASSVSGAALAAVMGKVVLAVGAFSAAYKAGEWVTMHGEMDALAESTEMLNTANAQLDEGLKKVAESTGLSIKTFEDLEKAEKEGLIVYNELTGEWEKGEEKKQDAIKRTAKTQEKSAKEQKKALADLKKEYDGLVKEIEDIDKQLTKLGDEGTEAQLKMANAARSPIDAWNAQKQAVTDLRPAMAAAKAEADKLAAAGDIEKANKSYARAVQLGQQMRGGFQKLATEVKAEFTPAMQEGLDAAKESAKKFGEEYSKAMEEAKKSGDDLKSTTESLADAEKGLADAARDATRDQMTAADAYRDTAAEQRELEAASKAAAKAGDYDLAIAKAREAQQVAAELNKEVKDGENTVLSAEEAKRRASAAEISARQLEVDALRAKQELEKKAEEEAIARAAKLKALKDEEAAKAKELEAKKAEIVKTEAEAAEEAAKLEAEARKEITKVLEAQREVLAKLADEKNRESDWTLGDTYTEAGEQAQELYEKNQEIQEQLSAIPAGAVIDWGAMWQTISEDGSSKADEVNEKWDQATRDRYLTITVTEVRANKYGGIQAFRSGGIKMPAGPARRYSPGSIIPGYSREDDRLALVRSGEGVLQPEPLRVKGAKDVFHNFNRGNFGGMAVALSNMPSVAPIIKELFQKKRPSTNRRPSISGKRTRTVRFIHEFPGGARVKGVFDSARDYQTYEKQMQHAKLVSAR